MKMFGSILGTTESVGYLLSLLQYPLFAWSNGPLNKDYRIVSTIVNLQYGIYICLQIGNCLK